MFLSKNLLAKNYFLKISFARYKNKYQKNMYLNVIGLDRDTKINPSTQFLFKQKRKCAELNRLLIRKFTKLNL